MKHSSLEAPQFYITSSQPCPYIEGLFEKKLFTTLNGSKAQGLNDTLSRQGFRRSQNIIYRPSCNNCSACKSVRIPVEEYSFSKSERRVLAKNVNLSRQKSPPMATDDQFDLFSRYLKNRHSHGGMSEMDAFEFSLMVEESNVHTAVYEYYDKEKLIAVCITDVIADGISMVYSFFDVENSKKNSLGKFMILDHIRIAKELCVKYLYLGYLIEASKKMNYKSQYHPLECFQNGKWIKYHHGKNKQNDYSSKVSDYNNPILLP